jgi:hypothetical protein
MLSLLLELLRTSRSVSTVGFNQQSRGDADSGEEFVLSRDGDGSEARFGKRSRSWDGRKGTSTA